MGNGVGKVANRDEIERNFDVRKNGKNGKKWKNGNRVEKMGKWETGNLHGCLCKCCETRRNHEKMVK